MAGQTSEITEEIEATTHNFFRNLRVWLPQDTLYIILKRRLGQRKTNKYLKCVTNFKLFTNFKLCGLRSYRNQDRQ